MANDAPVTADNVVDDAGLASMGEACSFLGGISRTALYSLLKRKELPSCTVGRLRLIPRRALIAFANRHMVAD